MAGLRQGRTGFRIGSILAQRAVASGPTVGRELAGDYTPRAMPIAVQVRRRVAAALAHQPCRPLAITGRTGSGKTRLLRALAPEGDREAVWCPAADLVGRVAESIECDRYSALRVALVDDPRPLVVEHLEDLRGKPRTRKELRSLLETASRRRPVLLTLTRARRDREVLRWLRSWAEVVSLD